VLGGHIGNGPLAKCVRIAAAIVAIVIFGPATGWSCSCATRGLSQCGGLEKNSIVFVGTVLNIENPPNKDPKLEDGGVSRYHFRVDENFVRAPGSAIDVYSGRGGADCSYHFQQGRQYLVFAYQLHSGDPAYASICSETQPVEYAVAVLPQLRAMRDRTKVASLYGRLERVQQPYTGTWQESFNQPLGKTILHIKSKSNEFQTQTDANGVYAFYDVPAGEYRVSAALPHGLEIAQAILSDPVNPLKLPARACYEYNVEAFPTGRIAGSVLGPDGVPLRSASVELFRWDAYQENERGWWEFQGDKRSIFQFLHVSPGDYLFVFNNGNRLDPDSPFPRTFYSSSADSAHAQVIHLGEGQQFLSADIHVSEGRPTRSLRVLLKWDDDTMPPDPLVFVSARGSEGDEPNASKIKPGVYRVTLLRDAHYKIEGIHYCERECDDSGCGPAAKWKTNTIEVDGNDERTPEVTLSFPPPPGGCTP
jgi:hypothetical protein